MGWIVKLAGAWRLSKVLNFLTLPDSASKMSSKQSSQRHKFSLCSQLETNIAVVHLFWYRTLSIHIIIMQIGK